MLGTIVTQLASSLLDTVSSLLKSVL